jgi:7,8-dihydropterin-6-yl-methyl-4-(beta-D-ribofuranosyl)aminobenzene 5'-phosphate synthase
LERDVHEIEAIILSHGHMDHHGSLQEILSRKSNQTPVVVHPDVFLENRFLLFPNGEKVTFPVLNESSLQKNGAQVIKNTVPYPLGENLVLATGEIKRSVYFEQGIPHAYCERSGITERDTILDDQCLILHLKDKGLVIITGCAHSGIINTIRYAQEITGVNLIYALIGGFHLSGVTFEPIIDKTLEVIKAYSPAVICPMHCTGWKATTALARLMPQQFVLSSVGTTLIL